jgi:hypothetical protein
MVMCPGSIFFFFEGPDKLMHPYAVKTGLVTMWGRKANMRMYISHKDYYACSYFIYIRKQGTLLFELPTFNALQPLIPLS